MRNISLFTPVCYGKNSTNLKNRLGEIADDYFYLGGRRAHVINLKNPYQVEIRSDQIKTAYKAFKLISYGTILIPLIFLIIKLAHRKTRQFNIVKCDAPSILKTELLTLKPIDQSHAEPLPQEAEKETILENNIEYGTDLDPSKLLIPGGEIKEGHGEYVVFSKDKEGKNNVISKETYEKVYNIMNRFSPQAMAASDLEFPVADYYDFISDKIKKIDEQLRVVFIPRTLYELYFIKKSIKEEIKANANCKALAPYVQELLAQDPIYWDETAKECHQKQLAGKCWHQRYVKSPKGTNLPGIKEIAYRLNQHIVKKVLENNNGFSYSQLRIHLEKELTFLNKHFDKITNASPEDRKQMHFICCDRPGAATSFGVESTRGSIQPLTISQEYYKGMIRDVVALECSEVAKKSFLFFRGGRLKDDNCFTSKKMLPKNSLTSAHEAVKDNKEVPYSLSYGTSLFAGFVFDPGACAFQFIKKILRAYIIPVPKERLRDSPFYLPSGNAVSQLFGWGELFHARTKAWQGSSGKILGIRPSEQNEDTQHLLSSHTKQSLIQQFIDYKKKALILKGHEDLL